VRALRFASSLLLATVVAGPAFAQPPQPAATPTAAPSAQARVATPQAQGTAGKAQLSPEATAAVQVVNTFMASLASGQLEAARKLMTPDAVVMVDGQVIGNRDAYIDGAAKGDAAALKTVQRELLRRDAKAGPNFGWVLSEKRLRSPGSAQGPSEVVTETMLLARTAEGWKIAHIHWSGRRAG
jgi:ketosteroid isomerase-like protein